MTKSCLSILFAASTLTVYADKKNIPYVIFIGEEELASGKVKLKDMSSGEQSVVSEEDLLIKIAGN